MNEIQILLRNWLNKETASIKEMQSLLEKLNFIAACVRPGRIFVSRMLKWLTVLYSKDLYCCLCKTWSHICIMHVEMAESFIF